MAAGGGPYGVIPEDYNLEERPTPLEPNGDAAQLEVGFTSLPYDDPKTDCISGKLELSLRVWLYWYDPRLVFPQQVSNRTGVADFSVPIDPDNIWKPDLDVAERIGEEFCSDSRIVLSDLVLKHDLKYNMMWARSCNMVVQCSCNLEDFPFDEQKCSATWVPLAERGYNIVSAGKKLNFNRSAPEFMYSFFTDNSPKLPWSQRMSPSSHSLGEQQAIRNVIRFDRHPEYYVVNFLTPTMMLVFMEWFTFLIPLDKADRVAYGVTLLLANVATQFITADRRPPTKRNTWIDLFSTVSLILIVYPILITVFLLRFSGFLSRKVESITDEQKKKEYEEHVTGLIVGVDRLSRALYPVFVFLAYAYVFTTTEFGSRAKLSEVMRPQVARLLLFLFVIPASIILMWFSITSLVNSGSVLPDAKVLWDLFLGHEDRESSRVDDTDDDTEESLTLKDP